MAIRGRHGGPARRGLVWKGIREEKFLLGSVCVSVRFLSLLQLIFFPSSLVFDSPAVQVVAIRRPMNHRRIRETAGREHSMGVVAPCMRHTISCAQMAGHRIAEREGCKTDREDTCVQGLRALQSSQAGPTVCWGDPHFHATGSLLAAHVDGFHCSNLNHQPLWPRPFSSARTRSFRAIRGTNWLCSRHQRHQRTEPDPPGHERLTSYEP